MEKDRCELPASGFTETLNAVYDWAGNVVSEIRNELLGKRIVANLWAYREKSHQILSLDLEDENGDIYGITFLTGRTHDYAMHTPSVPDMAEALHMAGMITDALNARVSVGLHANEVNPHCIKEVMDGQANGRLSLRTEHRAS